MADNAKGVWKMSDEQLLTLEEAAAMWREKVDELIERDPEAARSLLRLPSSAPLELPEALLWRGSWVGMLTRAIEVRCVHQCDHDQRYAYLRFGLLCCKDCIGERYADARPRADADGDCDICGAHADRFVYVRHEFVEASVMVIAKSCVGCGELAASLALPPGPSPSLN